MKNVAGTSLIWRCPLLVTDMSGMIEGRKFGPFRDNVRTALLEVCSAVGRDACPVYERELAAAANHVHISQTAGWLPVSMILALCGSCPGVPYALLFSVATCSAKSFAQALDRMVTLHHL